MLCLKACLGTKKTVNFLMSGQSVASESCRVGDGCEQDRRIHVLIDQRGTKLAVPLLLFLPPPFAAFSPFLEPSTAEKPG